ncbi:O-acetyl-ADP-ribose deacetylase (regulator of RNase III), contains Macro domain [Raineyella antarctica]|uniref:O-acetyl-ADP-ribose deacetylase (Regulator of RNase III), contains Macro domain n=1 Tax=Raineyella antarctica TaxID=1577474 RepID=A0A1G6GEC1_9ACTN|nr:O-acetyl-ADP-ribose deacetylase [Raineyella antarctica]SDB80304.1 O-acetyl-ADP-ribose deacetylase (regulator of RNase III), contains Macro domain [Raineyella antarctica]
MTNHAAVSLVLGDIVAQRVDAIVNAANPSLLGGGGVDGAIHRAGGPEILAACQRLRETSLREGLMPGHAVATTAGKLAAQWVIHTVGPIWSPTEDRTAILMSAYRECLRVADELAVTTIAFPAISAGAYGWPLLEAARVAITTTSTTPTQVAEVTFVLRDQHAYDIFRLALDELGS